MFHLRDIRYINNIGSVMLNNFKRYEIKYRMDISQIIEFKKVLDLYMKLDKYKKHTINNLYLDTESNLLIRRSIDKPSYKEKLRIRFYNDLVENTNGFIEIKKKFDKVVYKRRISLNYNDLIKQVSNNRIDSDEQIAKEINYCLQHYNLKPKLQLTYKREAYYQKNSNLRITIDNEIKYKTNDIYNFDNKGLFLNNEIYLVEVKTDIGLPKWLLDFFSEKNIYKTSFSKYGEIFKLIKENERSV